MHIKAIYASLSCHYIDPTLVIIASLYYSLSIGIMRFSIHAIVNNIFRSQKNTVSAHILQCAVAKLRACYLHS